MLLIQAVVILVWLSFTRSVNSASSATVFESTYLPDASLMATVGNGYLATAVYSGTVYVSGVFNGRGTAAPSHRARIPSTCDISLRTNVSPEGGTKLYSLNVSEGIFRYNFTAKNFTLEQRVYAHRLHEHVIVSEVSVSNSMDEDVLIAFDTRFGPTSDDINFTVVSQHDMKYFDKLSGSYKAMKGYIRETEETDSLRIGVAVVWTEVPRNPVTIPKSSSKKWYFVTAIASNLDAKDFMKSAYDAYAAATSNLDGLLASHVNAWTDLWNQGRVEMEGNLPLAQAVYGSLYYILSSIRASWPYGLSPGGLASDGYYGHTFWDQETWMYPPILLLYPDLARSCLDYRMNRLGVAKDRAGKRGYKGAMFPWESAVTGNEVCPGPIYATYEQHITGDIGFAAKQYYIATHDRVWLKETGSKLIYDTAEFWASRVIFNQSKGAYVINDVMPPDEYRGVVNNSVFTNVIARLNLEFASKVLENVPANWITIAKNMFIPFDKQKQYHPEYEGYNLNIRVKQADAILLGFPLMFNMSKTVRRNDLSLYEPRTDPSGPAMTKSMFAVNWLDVSEIEKAEISFNKSYANVQEPFKVWTEVPGGGAVNFITGAGGFLQAVVFGYSGWKLHEDHLEFNPRLLPGTTQVKVIGVDYLGNSIDLVIGSRTSNVTVTSRRASSPVLVAVVQASRHRYTLGVGKTVQLPNTLTDIQAIQLVGTGSRVRNGV